MVFISQAISSSVYLNFGKYIEKLSHALIVLDSLVSLHGKHGFQNVVEASAMMAASLVSLFERKSNSNIGWLYDFLLCICYNPLERRVVCKGEEENRKILYFSLIVLMVVTMWVCCNSWQVGAIRVLESNDVGKVKFSHGIVDKKEKEDLLHKYFSGRSTFGLSHKPFDENKRKVPSCPDPLHN
ncbi:hypothetical protein P8452_47991 [Trifolium repens]|nr:hypothetical protein P8452_47991 [Trifolium repens]